MTNRVLVWLVVIVTMGAGSACSSQMDSDGYHFPTTTTLAPGDADRLRTARMFFAHQSVGQNIIDGLLALQAKDDGAVLNIVDAGASPPHSGFLMHARLGRNGDPRSKTDAFADAIDGLGPHLDLAFQKYCYADIDARTDVRQLFMYYRQAMSRLKQRHPGLQIVHVTTPIVAVQSGPKAAVKKLIGRMPDHYADNFKREEFNDLMRQEYEGREPLFDLAALESSAPAGGRQEIEFRGMTSHALVPQYTYDGGHLTAPAQEMVAAGLRAFLAEVLDRRGSKGTRN